MRPSRTAFFSLYVRYNLLIVQVRCSLALVVMLILRSRQGCCMLIILLKYWLSYESSCDLWRIEICNGLLFKRAESFELVSVRTLYWPLLITAKTSSCWPRGSHPCVLLKACWGVTSHSRSVCCVSHPQVGQVTASWQHVFCCKWASFHPMECSGFSAQTGGFLCSIKAVAAASAHHLLPGCSNPPYRHTGV